VLVVVGRAGAGKSLAAERLAARLGAPRFATGDVVRAILRERGILGDPDGSELARLAAELERAPGRIGTQLAAEIAAAPGAIAIVEGPRAVAELDALRRAHPRTTVVAVEVGAHRRYARMLARRRPGEDNLAKLRTRDRVEEQRGLGEVLRTAELRIRPRGDDLASLDRSLAHALARAEVTPCPGARWWRWP
jgi:dephospho-CoA kinase